MVKVFPNPDGGVVNAVNHVNLQIQNGEFFSLSGPSGCGKTTSLRMIAGFEWPTSGEIFIKGEVMGHTPPFHRPVNTVFQSYALFQHMTIAQNVAFGLEMEHLPKAEIERRVGAGPRDGPAHRDGYTKTKTAFRRAAAARGPGAGPGQAPGSSFAG